MSLLTKIDLLECIQVAVGGVADAVSTLNLSGQFMKFFDPVDNSVFSKYAQTSVNLFNATNDNCVLDVSNKSLTFTPNGVSPSTYAYDHVSLLGGRVALSDADGLKINYPDGVGYYHIGEDVHDLGFSNGSGGTYLDHTGFYFQYDWFGQGQGATIMDMGGLRIYHTNSVEVLYYSNGISSTQSFNISCAGLTFDNSAGTAGQVLKSSGEGLMPVWANLPSVSPLLMFNFAVPSSPQSTGTIFFTDLGDTRVFTVPPAIMLMVADATGVIVHISLNGVQFELGKYVSFGWIASTAISAITISVYSLG